MKFSYKRLLTLFSVMVNIGFVIMAVSILIGHPGLFRSSSHKDIKAIVAQLDLPAHREKEVLDLVAQYRHRIDREEKALKEVRDDVIRLLAKPGPLDKDELHHRISAVKDTETARNAGFESHVIELRDRMGDEKGALFFSLLQKHLQEMDHRRHR